MIIAGIGSRETPADICHEMTLIGIWARMNGHWVRSGHADGADHAFERGAAEHCIAYMPFRGFNDKSRMFGHPYYPHDDGTPELIAWMREITLKYHPAPGHLSHNGLLFMDRNACQVLGSQYSDSSTWSKAVVCWTPDGLASGGTGQALRIAKAYGITVMNMWWPMYNTAQKVIKKLESL